ncbi:MAG: sedoheptulose 7-phosphate cyclase [Patescibacteria group bacterium]
MVTGSENRIKLKKDYTIEYDVIFKSGLFQNKLTSDLKRIISNKKLLVVVDTKFYDLHKNTIDEYFASLGNKYHLFLLDICEANKNLETVSIVCNAAREFKLYRDSYFIGIGGGITLDIVGFAASMYRRKSKYIRIPTTLVGMIDAGVGVKVGVNFLTSKNLIGSYYAPVATFVDQSFLTTLDSNQIRDGLYEIIKMGIIMDKKLFELVEHFMHKFFDKKLDNDTERIMYLSSIDMMHELAPNLHEHVLERSVDFGHTFSPHIEESDNYRISHGEAVGKDILLSTHIAHNRGLISTQDFDRIIKLIKNVGFTKGHNFSSVEDLHKSLKAIKRHRAGSLNLVVPTGIGSHTFIQECSIDEISEAVNFYYSTQNNNETSN